MPPDEPTEEERLQELPEDNQTPFQAADPNPSPTGNTSDPVVAASGGSDIPDDHPQTDTNIEPAELYDEGVSGAAETEDTSRQTAVTDFTPPDDDAPDETA
jgi:hypothetical protein